MGDDIFTIQKERNQDIFGKNKITYLKEGPGTPGKIKILKQGASAASCSSLPEKVLLRTQICRELAPPVPSNASLEQAMPVRDDLQF